MGEVRRHFRDNGWAMRVPRRLKELHLKTNEAVGELSERIGRAPRPNELAAHLGIGVHEVAEALAVGDAYHPKSLQQQRSSAFDAGTETVADTIGARDPVFEEVDNREALKPALRQLTPRDREVVLLRFYGNMTQSEIAKRLGISQMHVSRLLSRSLRTLREYVESPPVED